MAIAILIPVAVVLALIGLFSKKYFLIFLGFLLLLPTIFGASLGVLLGGGMSTIIVIGLVLLVLYWIFKSK